MCPTMRATRKPRTRLTPCSRRSGRRGSRGRSMIAARATSLNAMFCADRFGAAAITSACRDALRIADRPRERLHAAEAAAHHRGEALDAQPIGQPRLRSRPSLRR